MIVEAVKKRLATIIDERTARRILLDPEYEGMSAKDIVDKIPYKHAVNVEDDVLEYTLPLRNALEALKIAFEFLSGRGQSVAFVDALGTGKTHALALMREVIEKISRGDEALVESRIMKRIKAIEKALGAEIESEVRSFLEDVLDELRKLKVPRGEAKIVVLTLEDLNRREPIYNIILEKLGLGKASTNIEATKALEKYPKRVAIFIDEADRRYVELREFINKDREFYKALGGLENVLFVFSANYVPGDEEFKKILRSLADALHRFSGYEESEFSLRHALLLAGLAGEPKSYEYIREIYSLTSLESEFRTRGENILRDSFRYGLARLALYLISGIYREGYTLSPAVFPTPFLDEIAYIPERSARAALQEYRGFVKNKARRDPERVFALLKALLLVGKKRIKKERIKKRFSGEDPSIYLKSAGVIRETADRIELKDVFSLLDRRVLKFVMIDDLSYKVLEGLKIASFGAEKDDEVPTDLKSLEAVLTEKAKEVVKEVRTEYGTVQVTITTTPKDPIHVSVKVKLENFLESLAEAFSNKLNELVGAANKPIEYDKVAKAFYNVREEALKRVAEFTRVELPKGELSVPEFKEKIESLVSDAYTRLHEVIERLEDGYYGIEDVIRMANIPDRIPRGIVNNIIRNISKEIDFVLYKAGGLEIRRRYDPKKLARSVIFAKIGRRVNPRNIKRAYEECAKKVDENTCLEVLREVLNVYVLRDKALEKFSDFVKRPEDLKRIKRIFRDLDEAARYFANELAKGLSKKYKDIIDRGEILYESEIRSEIGREAREYPDIVYEKIVEEALKIVSNNLTRDEGIEVSADDRGTYYYKKGIYPPSNIGFTSKTISLVVSGKPGSVRKFEDELKRRAKELAKEFDVEIRYEADSKGRRERGPEFYQSR